MTSVTYVLSVALLGAVALVIGLLVGRHYAGGFGGHRGLGPAGRRE
jgi:hypothetical protein